MSAGLISLFLVVLALALMPMGLKWLQRRVGGSLAGLPAASKVVSVVAVGPQQRVVTVEAGPEHDRVWLVLGVTAQTVNCLHTSPAPARPADGPQKSAFSDLMSKPEVLP